MVKLFWLLCTWPGRESGCCFPCFSGPYASTITSSEILLANGILTCGIGFCASLPRCHYAPTRSIHRRRLKLVTRSELRGIVRRLWKEPSLLFSTFAMRQKPGDEFWFRVGSIPTINCLAG